MIFQRLNRDQAEKFLGVCKNQDGATINENIPVCFTTTASSNAGYEVVTPAAANLFTFAGVADEDISDAGIGLYQCYGYRDSVRIFAHGTSVTIAAGVAMGPAAGSDGVSSTGHKETYGPVVSMEAIGALITSPGGWAKGFIRTL